MLAHSKSGSGIPLVFLHAFPLSRQMWEINRPVFSRNFQLITVDLPGAGDSPIPTPAMSIGDMAEQVVKTLDELKIGEKILLAGLSMGGYVAFEIFRRFPDRIRALAFLSTRAAPDTPEAREKRFQNIQLVQSQGNAALAERMIPGLLGKSTLSSRGPLIEQVRSWIQAGDAEGGVACLRAMADRRDSSDLLSQIQIPALVLAGAEDAVIPPSEMEEMSRRLAKGEFHVLAGAGHLLNLEQPAAFQELFLHFLKRHVL